MKCIACGKEAEYLFLGNSYCQEHKEAHQVRIAKIDFSPHQSPIREETKDGSKTKGG